MTIGVFVNVAREATIAVVVVVVVVHVRGKVITGVEG